MLKKRAARITATIKGTPVQNRSKLKNVINRKMGQGEVMKHNPMLNSFRDF